MNNFFLLKKVRVIGFHLLLLTTISSLLFCSQPEEKTSTSTSVVIQQDKVKDHQGNPYPTIRIGEQIWMTKNVELTSFECVDSVKAVFTNGLERGPTVPFYDNKIRYAYYNNTPDLNFGVIYSYEAIIQCEICPSGFRIPTRSDWEELIRYLGGDSQAGDRLLQNGDSGFDAKIGGRIDAYGSVLAGDVSFWWSQDAVIGSDERLIYVFEVNREGIVKLVGQDYRTGNYVRCVKGN